MAYRAALCAADGTATDGRPLPERVADELEVARSVMASGAALDVLDGWAAITAELSAS